MRRRLPRGFTLIEVLVVVAVIAISMMVLVPRLSDWVASYRVSVGARQLAAGLRAGRAAAVQFGGRWVLSFDKSNVTAANGAGRCSYEPGTDDANRTFIVFQDADRDGTYDAGERVASCGIFPSGVRRRPTSGGYCGASAGTKNYGFMRDGGSKIHDNGVRSSFYSILYAEDYEDGSEEPIRTAIVGTATGQVCTTRLPPAGNEPVCADVRCPLVAADIVGSSS